MAARPSLNETDYWESAITTGSNGARLPDVNSSMLDVAILVLGNPTLPSTSLHTIRIDANLKRFLDANALWPALDAAEKLRTELESKSSLDMTLFVEQDSEAQDREELVLVYSLHDLEYKEILRIWDQASRRIQESLPAPIAERVYVRLTKA